MFVKDLFRAVGGLSVMLMPLVGVVLIVWSIVGQCVTQANFDGQIILWRIIPDISMIGWAGFAIAPIGCWLFWRIFIR